MSYWHDIVFINPARRRMAASASLIPVRVAELQHSEYQLVAIIFKSSEAHFEVRYYADFKNSQEFGWRLSVPEEFLTEKGKLRFKVLTFADCIPSAETIGREELEKLALMWGDQLVRRNQTGTTNSHEN